MPRRQPPADSSHQDGPPLLRRDALASSGVWSADEIDGRLRYAALVNGRARVLPTWLLTTPDCHVAARAALLLGGELDVDHDGLGQSYQVVTGHPDLDVLLDGPCAIRLRMLRRHGSTILRACDSRIQQTVSGKQPCQCPPTFRGRWEAAKTGSGCEPLVQVTIQLAADPRLGRFLLSSATWMFADHATKVKAALHRQHDTPVCARLLIDRALCLTRSGTTFAYTRPTIVLLPKPSVRHVGYNRSDR
jgi:hypothetical protein